MDNTINYDFSVSYSALKKLEGAAENIRVGVVEGFQDEVQTLSSCWKSDSACRFYKICELFQKRLNNTHIELLSEIEEINRITKRMRIAEEEAQRLANDRKN